MIKTVTPPFSPFTNYLSINGGSTMSTIATNSLLLKENFWNYLLGAVSLANLPLTVPSPPSHSKANISASGPTGLKHQ